MAPATSCLRLAKPERGYIRVTVRHSRSRRPKVPFRIQQGIPGLEAAGCTGLEPVASGVTGRKRVMAEPGNASQPTGNTGIGAATTTGFEPDLAGFETPRVTPELQSSDSQYSAWPRLFSVQEAASLLGVCTSTVYKLCAEGKLRHVRVSNAIRIPEAAPSAYV